MLNVQHVNMIMLNNNKSVHITQWRISNDRHPENAIPMHLLPPSYKTYNIANVCSLVPIACYYLLVLILETLCMLKRWLLFDILISGMVLRYEHFQFVYSTWSYLAWKLKYWTNHQLRHRTMYLPKGLIVANLYLAVPTLPLISPGFMALSSHLMGLSFKDMRYLRTVKLTHWLSYNGNRGGRYPRTYCEIGQEYKSPFTVSPN